MKNEIKSPFLQSVANAVRTKNYSIRTEQVYVSWAHRFILFHGKKHPRDMGEPEVRAFLTDLAVNSDVAASTQNQAFNALIFLYATVIGKPLGDISGSVRAKRPARIPVVLTHNEVRAVLRELDGVHWLAACLLYGSGLRLMECMRLRVKDVDFERRALFIRDGKGGKDRVVTLPDDLIPALRSRLEDVRTTQIYTHVLNRGGNAVVSPLGALLRG